MTELPVFLECRWRGRQLMPGRHACDSLKVVAPRGVTARLCGQCPFADHEPVPLPTITEPKPPGWLQLAANLIRDAARHVAGGFRTVPPEVYEERLRQCRACPLFADNRCTHRGCGCHMAGENKLLAALWWASKRCPDNPPRWLEHND